MAEITWEISGQKQSGTKIDAGGVLNVDATEEVGTKITVTAKTTVDEKELTGTATATVIAP